MNFSKKSTDNFFQRLISNVNIENESGIHLETHRKQWKQQKQNDEERLSVSRWTEERSDAFLIKINS